MSDADVRQVIERLARAMSIQRTALEAGDYDALEAILPDCESALADLAAFPGGVAALRQTIETLPAEDRSQLRAVLDQAGTDHRIGRDLIGLAMQRVAAVKSFQASKIEGATYSQQGGVSHATGSVLSHKV